MLTSFKDIEMETPINTPTGTEVVADNQDPVVEVIQPTTEPTPVKAVSKNAVKSTPSVLTLKDRVAKYLANGDINRQFIVSTLDEYVTKMAPNVMIVDNKGAEMQMRLWRLLKNLINQPQSQVDFKESWNLIIAYFKEYGGDRGVLSMRYVNRFFHAWSGSELESFAFQGVIGLLQISADPDPQSRQRQMGLINLDQMFAKADIFNEEGRQRIFAFYRT